MKGVEHASAHLHRRRMDVLFLKYRTYGYDSARDAVRGGRVGGVTGVATNIGAAHVVVSAALGLCTDAYTTCCWEQLSHTEQKRLVDAVAEGVALGDARGANPTLTMSHLPLHRSSRKSDVCQRQTAVWDEHHLGATQPRLASIIGSVR